MKGSNFFKDLISILLLFLIFISVYKYKDDIATYIIDIIYPKEITIQPINPYQVSYKYNYVKETDDFYIKSKQHFLDAFYTILNNGWNNFTFYCDKDYTTCISDINEIINNNYEIANINNFVNPLNSYESVSINIDTNGRIHILFLKSYSNLEIEKINTKTEQVINELINNNMSTKEKVKKIHDYIINNSSYNESKKSYSKATGILFEGHGVCSGYTDTMAIFLDKLKIPNYRIASNNHIWNLIYIDDSWKHLDLTWDDPVTNTGRDLLLDDYFLISTNKLHSLDNEEHNFNQDIYSEAK